ENIFELTLESPRPKRVIVGYPHELNIHPKTFPSSQQRALKDQVCPQLRPYRTNIERLVLEGKGGGLRLDLQPIDHREIADDFVRQPIAEIVVLGAGTQVLQGQDCNHVT